MSRARRQRRNLAQLDWLIELAAANERADLAWERAVNADLSYLWFTYRYCGDRGVE